MIREAKQGHLQFTSRQKRHRGKRKQNIGEDEIREGKEEAGYEEGEEINNRAKKGEFITRQP